MVGSLVYLLVKQRSPLRADHRLDGAIGVAYLGMAMADTLLVACLISIVGGAGNGIQWISVVTALQEMTPTDYQARIVGLLESLGAAMPGVGYLIGAALVALGSPRTAYAVAGAGVLVLVLRGARSCARACSGRRSPGAGPATSRVPEPLAPAPSARAVRPARPAERQRARTLEPHVT